MKKKAKAKSGKGKSAAKLKAKRVSKGAMRKKKASSTRKTVAKARKKITVARPKAKSAPAAKPKVVRLMGHGQFTVDAKTLKKLNDIDNALVGLVSQERSDDSEFKKRLTELNDIVVKSGKPLDPHEIIQSDIILPSADMSIDEAKRLFKGEGVIPEI